MEGLLDLAKMVSRLTIMQRAVKLGLQGLLSQIPYFLQVEQIQRKVLVQLTGIM